MIKQCVICGDDFDARGNVVTCSDHCRAIRKQAAKRADKARYREKYPEKVRAEKQLYRSRKRAKYLACHPEIADRKSAREARIRMETVPKMRLCIVCEVPFEVKCNVKTCSDACWKMRYSETRARKRQTTVDHAARLESKIDYSRRRTAQRAAALKLIRELQTKGLEALL